MRSTFPDHLEVQGRERPLTGGERPLVRFPLSMLRLPVPFLVKLVVAVLASAAGV